MSRLRNTGHKSKKMLVETFDRDCNFGLYTLEDQLFDLMVDGTQRFETLSVLNDSPYKNFNMQIKQACKRASKKDRLE